MPLPPLPNPDAGGPSPREETLALLTEARAPSEHLELLADVLLEDAQAVEPASLLEHVQQEVSRLELRFRDAGVSTDTKMVQALLALALPRHVIVDEGRRTEFVGHDGRTPGRRLRRLLARWLEAQPVIDVADGLLSLPPNRRRPDIDRCVLRRTARAGHLDVASYLDLDALKDRAGGGNPDDPTHVWFWLIVLGPDALSSLLPVVDNASDDDAGRLALGILEILRFHLEHGAMNDRDVVAEPRSSHVLRWIEHLENRLDRRPDDIEVAAGLWTLMRADLTLELDEAVEARLLDRTLRSVSRFRKQLSTGEVSAGAPWKGLLQHQYHAMLAVRTVGEPWKALKAALLLLRAVPYPTVGADLRHWGEPSDATEADGGPPTRWRWIAELTVGLAQGWAREDREDDPQLEEMREQMARYFLDRLRSRSKDRTAAPKSDADMLEPSPEWRRAYIQAVRALRVNPAGRGHHVLHWLQSNDPHEEVRKEASAAHGEMRQRVGLPPGSSPLRAVMSALWWVRWGHRCGLGLPVDHAAAQRTRQREIRRTKEVERIGHDA